LHLIGILFPYINDDAQSKSHQILIIYNSISFTGSDPLVSSPPSGTTND